MVWVGIKGIEDSGVFVILGSGSGISNTYLVYWGTGHVVLSTGPKLNRKGKTGYV